MQEGRTDLATFLPILARDLVQLENEFPKAFSTSEVTKTNLQLDLQFLKEWPILFSDDRGGHGSDGKPNYIFVMK